jgi:hypothetical protein
VLTKGRSQTYPRDIQKRDDATVALPHDKFTEPGEIVRTGRADVDPRGDTAPSRQCIGGNAPVGDTMVDVGVQVDESGEHEAPAGVDDFAPMAQIECGGDRGHTIAADCNIKVPVASSEWVDEVPTMDDKVVLHRFRPQDRR